MVHGAKKVEDHWSKTMFLNHLANECAVFEWATELGEMDNGLLFHMTQPTSRTTTRSHCTGQTVHNSEH